MSSPCGRRRARSKLPDIALLAAAKFPERDLGIVSRRGWRNRILERDDSALRQELALFRGRQPFPAVENVVAALDRRLAVGPLGGGRDAGRRDAERCVGGGVERVLLEQRRP